MTRFIAHLTTVTLAGTLFLACEAEQNRPVAEAAVQAAPAGNFAYSPPDGWLRQPPSTQMRKDQFLLPGDSLSADGELSVYHFPGMGGSIDANLERWSKQFRRAGTGLQAEPETREMMVNDIPVTLVFLEGTYLRPKNPMAMMGPKETLENHALLGAIATTRSGLWFFKATGPRPTMQRWRKSFAAFVGSFHIVRS